MFFAPAIVSALAIYLISPTTVEWILGRAKPSLENGVLQVLKKYGLPQNYKNFLPK